MRTSQAALLAPLLGVWAIGAAAQVTRADYDRATAVRTKFQNLAVNIPGPATWAGPARFVYRKSVTGGHEWTLVDAATAAKTPPFDHARLAAGLSAAAGAKYTALTLPFTAFEFVDNGAALITSFNQANWRCGLSTYTCAKAAPSAEPQRRNPPPEWDGDPFTSPEEPESPQQGRGRETADTPETPAARSSPDGKWEAVIQNFNVFLRAKESAAATATATAIGTDGSEGNFYTLRSIAWSPDSRYLVAYRVRPGYKREVHYVESSPADQLQPKHSTREYAKPGDALDIPQPVLFDIAAKRQHSIANTLFPNPYNLGNPVWWKDSRGFTFEYNQRGHQVFRVIEVAAATAQPRVLIHEESDTFVDYRPLGPNPRDTGKKVRHDLADGKEIVWGSERDGWEHLYLYDGVTGTVKNQITKGPWVVRAVEKVDEEKRQIWFQASGMYPGKDPYFTHYYRIDFDGTGLTALTQADGNHTAEFSPDRRYFVDTWSRVDMPPVMELRTTAEPAQAIEIERGDIRRLLAAGWRPPEVFTALGRDGKTDIWGLIYRPLNFDAAKRYPEIEAIYAGPQGSFVPKSFSPMAQSVAELGFIAVQIDGMGTNNRSKAFHAVAWKNLADAGFPDRILWHKAVAAKYPWYDIARVGIYGTSAGGQNAAGAVLFHPEFYKAAVANSGCHDNRMDKIWWNELWMSWPIGPLYAASSNVDNAHRLGGKLLLVVPEMDTNVDPASTYQVVNALIKAQKKFELLVVPGANHGGGGNYYMRLLGDFFVHHLLGVEPPDWNQDAPA